MATSFERIHRSNLVGMGVLPLVLPKSWQELGLTGEETFDIPFDDLTPRSTLEVTATRADGTAVSLTCTVTVQVCQPRCYYTALHSRCLTGAG